uniref:Uncharacterized protein n=1 Tax=Steinernema glaseri TaxID=37863 RepID=A0A1I7ZCG8_9BILA
MLPIRTQLYTFCVILPNAITASALLRYLPLRSKDNNQELVNRQNAKWLQTAAHHFQKLQNLIAPVQIPQAMINLSELHSFGSENNRPDLSAIRPCRTRRRSEGAGRETPSSFSHGFADMCPLRTARRLGIPGQCHGHGQRGSFRKGEQKEEDQKRISARKDMCENVGVKRVKAEILFRENMDIRLTRSEGGVVVRDWRLSSRLTKGEAAVTLFYRMLAILLVKFDL